MKIQYVTTFEIQTIVIYEIRGVFVCFVCVGPRIPDGIPVMGCPLRDLTSSPEVHVPLYQTLPVEFRHGRKAWDMGGILRPVQS